VNGLTGDGPDTLWGALAPHREQVIARSLDSARSRTSMQSGLIRRVNRRRPVYLLCALCLLPLALVAAEYGAGVPYFVLVAACVIQFVYPTVLGWGIVAVVFGLLCSALVFVIGRDLIGFAVGWQPHVLLDADDAAMVIFLATVVTVLFSFVVRGASVEQRCLTAAAAERAELV